MSGKKKIEEPAIETMQATENLPSVRVIKDVDGMEVTGIEIFADDCLCCKLTNHRFHGHVVQGHRVG